MQIVSDNTGSMGKGGGSVRAHLAACRIIKKREKERERRNERGIDDEIDV